MTASVQGCYELYSLVHAIPSRIFHELSESVEQNTPRLLIAQNSPATFGFAVSMEMIVPLGSGTPFVADFHTSLFSSSYFPSRSSM
jgi:hypothetical protein